MARSIEAPVEGTLELIFQSNKKEFFVVDAVDFSINKNRPFHGHEVGRPCEKPVPYLRTMSNKLVRVAKIQISKENPACIKLVIIADISDVSLIFSWCNTTAEQDKEVADAIRSVVFGRNNFICESEKVLVEEANWKSVDVVTSFPKGKKQFVVKLKRG